MLELQELKKYYEEPLYKNSIYILLNTGLGSIFGVLFWIVATGTLPSAEVGLLTGIISASTLILTGSRLGMDTGIMRFLPGSTDKSSLYSSANIVTLSVSLLLTAIFLVGLNIFSPALMILRDGLILPIFVLYIIISSICYMQNITLMASRRADLYFVQNLILCLRVPLLFIFYYMAPTITGVLLIIEIAYLGSLLYGSYALSKSGLKFRLKFNWQQVRETWKYSLGGYTSNLFNMLPSTVLPILIINTAGLTSNAYFFIAYSIASFMMMIPSAICSSLFVEGSHEAPLGKTVIKAIKFLALLMIPMFILIFLFSDKLLLLFGKEYSSQSIDLLRLLIISSLFSAITLVYVSIKKVQKDMMMVNLINSSLSILVIVLGYIMLNIYGLIGIGYAWLITNIVISAIVLIFIIRIEKWITFDKNKLAIVR